MRCGKIERYFRTVREKFLPFINLQKIDSIDELNRLFELWLDKEYNKGYHHGICMKPIYKYMLDIKDTSVKRISKEELEKAFLRTVKRKVKNDSTISFEGVLYEAPTRFIGRLVEIRHPIDKPDALTIYEQDKPVCQIKKVNLIEKCKLTCNLYELQIITNFQMDSLDPAIFILIGQPHIRDRLLMPIHRSINQRITLKYHITPLSRKQTYEYIEHHLKLSGVNQTIFNENAMAAIYQISSGIPRVINSIAIKAMTIGALEKKDSLTEEEIYRASKEL